MIIYIILILLFFTTSILLAKKLSLYDYPNSRKNHLVPVINIGGFPIIFSIFCAFFLFDFDDTFFLSLIFSIFFLLLGFIDDRINLNPFLRIFIQFFFAISFLYLTEIRIINIFLTREIILPSYLSYFLTGAKLFL